MMRLLTKNTIIYLSITLVVFLLGGFIFHFELKNIMDEEATEVLYLKKKQIVSYVRLHNKFPEPLTLDELLFFTPVNTPVSETLSDTMVFDEAEGEVLPYRTLTFPFTFEGKSYKVSISKSLFESEDLVETIIVSFCFIAAVLIVLLLTINYMFSRRIWRPFFDTLKMISSYDLETHQVLDPKKSSTKEFMRLNEAIYEMTSKLSSDFQSLKAFTEHAAHELQTPLAIIKNKTELLLQSEGLTEAQMKQIAEINHTANRLRKLNQTLLLLAKIENNQFKTNERIDLRDLVLGKLEQYEDLLNMKQLQVHASCNEPVHLMMHPMLGDVVISNLLSNAIKYTPEKGQIYITCSSNRLIVANTGDPMPSGGKQLFERFYKEDAGSDSIGLGLALVKQIAMIHHHSIEYTYAQGLHTFTYSF